MTLSIRRPDRLQPRAAFSRTLAALAVGLALLALPGAAGALPPVGETPFSGRFAMQVDGREIAGKVFHSEAAERREMQMQGETQVIILRPLEAEVLVLMPQQNMAMRQSLPNDPGLKSAEAFAQLEPVEVGRESVNGESTTVYDTTKRIDGRFWVTDDGIVMRMRTETAQGPLTMELLEVARGAQPAELFEVPEGMQVIDAPQQ